MKYWLMKTEPDEFSIDNLEKDKVTWWEGVRNYQARNFMMKEMSVGDLVLFYHSNANPSGIAGVARISHAARPDELQFNRKSDYFDAKSFRENPRWHCVQVQFVKKFKNFIPLEQIRKDPKLYEMLVIKKGQRLSIQPVKKEHFDWINKLGNQ